MFSMLQSEEVFSLAHLALMKQLLGCNTSKSIVFLEGIFIE